MAAITITRVYSGLNGDTKVLFIDYSTSLTFKYVWVNISNISSPINYGNKTVYLKVASWFVEGTQYSFTPIGHSNDGERTSMIAVSG